MGPNIGKRGQNVRTLLHRGVGFFFVFWVFIWSIVDYVVQRKGVVVAHVLHTYIHTYMHTYIHTYTHTFIHTRILVAHAVSVSLTPSLLKSEQECDVDFAIHVGSACCQFLAGYLSPTV